MQHALPGTSPSNQLEGIIRELRPHIGSEDVTLSGASFDQLVLSLIGIRKMTASLEREVGALRLAEAGRQGRRAVEQLAMDQFVELVVDPEGKVVRPDFSKGGRS